MPYRRYNPNTKYGRRKARQQAWENYQNLPPDEKAERDRISCLIMAVIFIIVCLVVFLFSGTEGLIRYLKR